MEMTLNNEPNPPENNTHPTLVLEMCDEKEKTHEIYYAEQLYDDEVYSAQEEP